MINLTKITGQISGISSAINKVANPELKLQPQLTTDVFMKKAGIQLKRGGKFSDCIISCGHNKSSIATKINFERFKEIFGFELLSPTKKGLNAFKYGIDTLYQNKKHIQFLFLIYFLLGYF